MLEVYREARDGGGDPDVAEEILNRAIETAQEASYRISQPVGELRVRCGDLTHNPVHLIDQLLRDIGKGFMIEVHRDLKASLNELASEELTVVYRIASEALWNAARHAGAKNIWVESRKVGSDFFVEVRDDWRGLSEESRWVGLGLSPMRSRAERVGAELRLISEPGESTTVRLRFDRR